MRVYSATTEIAAVAAAQTLLTVEAPSDAVVAVLRAYISQLDLVASEMFRAHLQKATDDGTGAAVTPEPHEEGNAAFGGTVQEDHSVEPTYTGIPYENEEFNVLNGWVWVPMPEERIYLSPGETLGLRLDVAPSAGTVVVAGLVFGEIGG